MTRIFLTGASGYIGGDVLHALKLTHPEHEYSVLLRDEAKAVTLSKAYPDVRVVLGDLDSVSLIEDEASRTDDSVLAALEQASTTFPRDDLTGPGTAWPVFIAGCEAMTPTRRDAVLRLLDKSSSSCGTSALRRLARNIVTEMWRRQDEHLTINRGEAMPSWIDIVKQEQTWPFFPLNLQQLY